MPAKTLHLTMFSKLLRRKANNPLSAPLAHLLTSNIPPSDVEETLARNTIQALQDSLPVLQLEIDNYPSDPRTAAADLEGHKTTIIKNISAHESIISPLRKLPPELLKVIFQKTCWDPVTTFTLPWSLSQVCQSWRMIVHTTPILWSCITINVDTKPTTLRLQKARLKFILQRSFNVDLRISICGCRRIKDKRITFKLILILMAHSERWGYLNLDFTNDAAKGILSFQAVKGRLPKLSQLYLKFGERRLTGPMTIDMFRVAPRLEKFVLIDNAWWHPRIGVTVPVPLQHLSLSSCYRAYSGELISSLAILSHLVHLEIMLHATDPLEPRITFPRLKVLVVYFYKNSANGFFERLVLPCISEIRVRGKPNGITLAISSMILRSLPCNLRTLSVTIDRTLENRRDLTSLLLLTPQLQNLRIHLQFDLDLFATLVSLPKLRSLFIVVPAYLQVPVSFVSLLATSITTQIEMPSCTEEEFHLRKLQLEFSHEFECRTAYLAMQPSPEVGELDDDVLALINSWKKRLVGDILGLLYHSLHINKSVYRRRLNELFNAIEGYDIPTSGYLHVSDSSQN